MCNKSCKCPEGLQLYEKESTTQVCSCEYSQSFRDSFFNRTTLVVSYELSFSIRKEFLKREINGKIAFALISLFHVQIQKPQNRSTTTRAFVFLAQFAGFYYHKIFETSHDNLSICLDKCSLCNLSLTQDIKIYQCCMITM